MEAVLGGNGQAGAQVSRLRACGEGLSSPALEVAVRTGGRRRRCHRVQAATAAVHPGVQSLACVEAWRLGPASSR